MKAIPKPCCTMLEMERYLKDEPKLTRSTLTGPDLAFENSWDSVLSNGSQVFKSPHKMLNGLGNPSLSSICLTTSDAESNKSSDGEDEKSIISYGSSSLSSSPTPSSNNHTRHLTNDLSSIPSIVANTGATVNTRFASTNIRVIGATQLQPGQLQAHQLDNLLANLPRSKTISTIPMTSTFNGKQATAQFSLPNLSSLTPPTSPERRIRTQTLPSIDQLNQSISNHGNVPVPTSQQSNLISLAGLHANVLVPLSGSVNMAPGASSHQTISLQLAPSSTEPGASVVLQSSNNNNNNNNNNNSNNNVTFSQAQIGPNSQPVTMTVATKSTPINSPSSTGANCAITTSSPMKSTNSPSRARSMKSKVPNSPQSMPSSATCQVQPTPSLPIQQQQQQAQLQQATNTNSPTSRVSAISTATSSTSVSADGKRRIHKCLFNGCKKSDTYAHTDIYFQFPFLSHIIVNNHNG
ncbi:hypothetical protein BLOT_003147 [Blomia tropicalis]|nr:hypothetical protein BLOT_003147 [Blomia tropicalis]